MTTIFRCKDCGYEVVIMHLHPTATGPCICGHCNGKKFTVLKAA